MLKLTSYRALGGCAFLAVALGCLRSESSVERQIKQAALANPRPVEGRLSVSVPHTTWNGSNVAERFDPLSFPDGGRERVLRGRHGQGEHEPEELHLKGLLSLFHGATAHAVSQLETAAERSPTTAAVLSDLSVAYLALAQEDQPWLHVDAIAAAGRAVEQAPKNPYAAFNLALALERMSLTYQASRAWERYLTIEDHAAWRYESSERLARLSALTTADRWEEQRHQVIAAASAGDRASLARLARDFPRHVKDLLEVDLLPAWANAAGTPMAGVRVATAKRVAETLAIAGEPLYADAITAIENRPQSFQTLADGHRAYAEGLTLRHDCSQAVPAFESAFVKLAAGGSPLAWAARLELLVCTYRGRPPEAETLLSELALESEVMAYPSLLARVEGMRGLCAMVGGRHSQAVAHYERAAGLLTRIGETDLSRLHGMLDEAYRFLGDRDSAWRYRLAALRGAVAAGNRQIRHAILAGLARTLVEGDRREIARPVLDEMLANAREWSQPGAVAETLLRRIQLHLRNEAVDEAAADIEACAAELERFQQPADRDHLESELAVASAEHRLATRPMDALPELAPTVARLESGGHGLLLPRALFDLAFAHLAVGERESAETALEKALHVYEERRTDTDHEWHRITFFSTAQPSFDAMIRFQAFERRDPHAAFVYSERVRARSLRDHLEAGIEVPATLELDRKLARIPADVALIAYSVLPDVLLTWQLRQGSLEMHVVPIPRTGVVELVSSVRAALTGGAPPDAAPTVAARAFDLLLRPVLDGVPAGTELVFVLDRELHQIPFAALFNEVTGRYLVEDHACTFVPSLGAYLASLASRNPVGSGLRRVVAVGDPAFNQQRFPALPRLPHAYTEALAVATLYEDGFSLLGEEATRQRVLDGVPGTDVLHLAAHVVLDPRSPLSSEVATADLGGVPLRASDFGEKRLAGVQLVFLAACDSAPGFGDGDREGVAGLTRAFLAAGVPMVVAALWAVDDEAAARLAPIFHARLLEGESPAQALRLAQLALLTDSSSFAPFAWAPYQLYRGP